MAAFMEQAVQMEFPWNRLRVLELIGLYKAEDVLWNISNRDYHNKAMRQAALVRLSAKLAAPVHEVNKKLMNLRTYYSKELAKVKRSRARAAAGGGEVYHSPWPYFHHMDHFLSPHVVPRKSLTQELREENGEVEVELEGEAEQTETLSPVVIIPSPPTPPPLAAPLPAPPRPPDPGLRWSSFPEVRVARRRTVETPPLCSGMGVAKRHREDLFLREAVRAYKTATATASLVPASLPPAPPLAPAPPAAPPPPPPPPQPPAPPREDVDDVFGRHVANELRLVGDLRAKQYAKLQIQNILFQAQFGLSQAPHLVSSPFPSPAAPPSPDGQPLDTDFTPDPSFLHLQMPSSSSSCSYPHTDRGTPSLHVLKSSPRSLEPSD
ncbi:hypothetical protein SKAU_G00076210 [Synaphobranchus kaupii]|uniref:MADF domain-containing protein n=1 Tax=Synaphobranchus kaupii TaxID=118154 RepID=A0A9Q1JB04_SYNKA|nr:hypothetical protein SKAU_G00076210 [Synaphobranchus kaupii]